MMFQDIRAVYDFDTFVRGYRPNTADKGVKKAFCISQKVEEVDGEDRVFVRSKTAIGAKTAWSAWTQMYPSVLDLRPQPPHPPSAIPATAANKVWDDFGARIAPTLTRHT